LWGEGRVCNYRGGAVVNVGGVGVGAAWQDRGGERKFPHAGL